MRLAISAMLVCLVSGLCSPVAASTVDVLSIDSAAKVISTKKKPGKASGRSPLAFSETLSSGVGVGSPFALGELRQTKRSLRKKVTNLSVNVQGEAQGASFALNLMYQFKRGAGPGCTMSAKQCSRSIRITPISSSPITVVSGNETFTIQADGFVAKLGDSAGSLLVPKNKRGKKLAMPMYLQARVSVTTTDPSPVPIPPAGLLLLGAVGAAGLASRKRRTAA